MAIRRKTRKTVSRPKAKPASALGRALRERDEAQRFQAASADILASLSRSSGDAAPVFEAIVENVLRVFGTRYAAVFIVKGNELHLGAAKGDAQFQKRKGAEFARFRDSFPQRIDYKGFTGKALRSGKVSQLAPVIGNPDATPQAVELAKGFGYDAMLVAPLMREGKAIGAIGTTRPEGEPFDVGALALFEAFADQAVIAIENARLFNETREALERETATSEVLKTISRSTFDLNAVLQVLIENATRLAGASRGFIFRFDGQVARLAFSYNAPPAYRDLIEANPIPPGRGTLVARTLLEGRPVHIPDVLADPHFTWHEAQRLGGFRSMLGVPMARDGKPIGVIAMWSDVVKPFTDKQIELVATFAAQAVIAIENVRLFDETREALEQQTATSEILQVTSKSPTDVKPVFDTILANAMRLCEGSAAVLWTYDGGKLRIAAHNNMTEGAVAYIAAHPLEPGDWNPTAQAALERRTVHVLDVFAEPRYRPLVPMGTTNKRPNAGTVLAVPLMRDGDLLGVITVWRYEKQLFTAKQLAMVNTFAAQAVIAIENVRLFNDTKEALEQQTATAEILKVMSGSPTDVQPVFDAILRSAVTLCGAELAAVFPFDGKLVHLGATHNWPSAALQYFSKIYPSAPSPELLSGRTILSRSIVQIPDAAADEHYDPDSVATGHWRRMLGAPMLREGRPLGALVVAWREPGATPQRQVELLQTFADQAAIAIENVRLFNETKEALDRQTATADILRVISSSQTDLQPVFDTIIRNCVRLGDASFGSLFHLDAEGRIEIGAHHNFDTRAEALFRARFPHPLSPDVPYGKAMIEGAAVNVPDFDTSAFSQASKERARALGTRAVLAVPLMRQGRAIGAIAIGRREPGAFADAYVSLIRTFADQAVIAIENVRLFREIQEKSAQLEVANKHKSDFLASMSHELRTPLNAIIGFSEVLSERMFGEVNEKQAEYLKDIHESGRHLLSLINDILDLSKIEAGRMELELSRFHLPSAVSNAMTLVRERAQRHGIQLAVTMDPGLGELQADERKVKQILLNLLSNAVKFTPDGGRVDVSARKADGKVEIAVQDTGIGIAPEDHAAVFEEFKQVGRDYTRKAEGTGLGLALTRRLVELHGGDIALESAPGKGSTFTVKLPLR